MASDTAKEFADKLEDMIRFLIPNYIKEGKTSLVIGIGCTGGKHRSVTIARELFPGCPSPAIMAFVWNTGMQRRTDF